ncbi:hypothetical protein EJB05_47931, partial [Eragrostis curvula]
MHGVLRRVRRALGAILRHLHAIKHGRAAENPAASHTRAAPRCNRQPHGRDRSCPRAKANLCGRCGPVLAVVGQGPGCADVDPARSDKSCRIRIRGQSSLYKRSSVRASREASSDREMDVLASTGASALLTPAANEMKLAARGAGFEFVFEGMVFTVTEGNEVAEVLDRGAVRVLGSESFFDEDIGTREHFVDVQGRGEAILLLVSVREDQRRIVAIRRFS